MAVKIRLRRMGTKQTPFYRVVVADERTARNGRFLESLGTYDPRQPSVGLKVDADKALRWLELCKERLYARLPEAERAEIDRLTPEQRTIVTEEGRRAGNEARAEVQEKENAYLADMEKAGVQITRPDVAKFRPLMGPAYAQLKKVLGDMEADSLNYSMLGPDAVQAIQNPLFGFGRDLVGLISRLLAVFRIVPENLELHFHVNMPSASVRIWLW